MVAAGWADVRDSPPASACRGIAVRWEQLRRVAEGDEAFVGDPERVAQFGDEPVLVGEVGACGRDGLKLDERPKLLDLIEMDAHAAPKQQMTALGDDPAYPDRSGERRAQHCAVADLDDAIAALALLRLVRALELDQMRTAGLLLAELEPPCATSK